MYIDLGALVKQIENSIEVGQAPTLATLKYGEREASTDFIRSIERKGSKLGARIVTQDLEGLYNPGVKIVELINFSDATLPVRPFPEVTEQIIKNRLDGYKDIDNFTGLSKFPNCTGQAVLEILKYLEIGIEKKICILGRGIGFEIYKVLQGADYSPRPIHSKTPDTLAKETIRTADVVISATGVNNLIKRHMVKKGSIVIDVGLGDVEKGVEEIADVTTIRDGVGAVTTAILFKHIFQTTK